MGCQQQVDGVRVRAGQAKQIVAGQPPRQARLNARLQVRQNRQPDRQRQRQVRKMRQQGGRYNHRRVAEQVAQQPRRERGEGIRLALAVVTQRLHAVLHPVQCCHLGGAARRSRPAVCQESGGFGVQVCRRQAQFSCHGVPPARTAQAGNGTTGHPDGRQPGWEYPPCPAWRAGLCVPLHPG